MKDSPPLLKLTRQTIAHMGAIKVALDTIAIASGTATAVSGLASVLAGTKIALILPIVASLVGVVSLVARSVISYYMSVAVIDNPLPGSYQRFVIDQAQEKP